MLTYEAAAPSVTFFSAAFGTDLKRREAWEIVGAESQSPVAGSRWPKRFLGIFLSLDDQFCDLGLKPYRMW